MISNGLRAKRNIQRIDVRSDWHCKIACSLIKVISLQNYTFLLNLKLAVAMKHLTVQMETTKTAPFENLPRRMRFLWSDTALQLCATSWICQATHQLNTAENTQQPSQCLPVHGSNSKAKINANLQKFHRNPNLLMNLQTEPFKIWSCSNKKDLEPHSQLKS